MEKKLNCLRFLIDEKQMNKFKEKIRDSSDYVTMSDFFREHIREFIKKRVKNDE